MAAITTAISLVIISIIVAVKFYETSKKDEDDPS